ncbi:MAG: B12-binding domain-containing radical SAM protein [Armatimonadetes bacterium]|nr:B12-binding domain-containing radical SAM protein [Armatimonadota bacterium]
MRISLIHVQCLEGNNIVPPLGLMYVASALEENGHHVQMFDVDPSVVDVSEKIEKFRPHLIGFSFLSMTHKKAMDYCGALKARFPGTLFCAGGYHATIFPEETARQMELDFAVIGEGEETLVEACRAVEEKGDLSGVAGVVYRDDQGQYRRTPQRPLQKNLDLFPFPARRLLPFDRYLTPPGLIRGYATERLTTMVTSRGCPYSCIYCGSWQIFGRKVRRRSVENVISEIRSTVVQFGIKGLYFCDDIFVTDKDWVIGLSRRMREEGFRIEWACQTRVDTVSDEVLSEMKKAGCVQIDFGVESGSDRILKVLRKGVLSAQVEEAFRLVHKNGIRACATFMLGNPEETKEDMEQTLRLAKKIKPDYAIFYYTTPYPRTVL